MAETSEIHGEKVHTMSWLQGNNFRIIIGGNNEMNIMVL